MFNFYTLHCGRGRYVTHNMYVNPPMNAKKKKVPPPTCDSIHVTKHRRAAPLCNINTSGSYSQTAALNPEYHTYAVRSDE